VANGTDYALSACMFGRTGPATAIAGRLDAGSVSVNSAPGAPLGGRRAAAKATRAVTRDCWRSRG
jgi:acyl-CoA reductase-like NAD-dependent aldehyde dehydrogenase